MLQVSASEAESQQLLIRHVERIVPGAGAAVLNRSETEDRLEVALGGERGRHARCRGADRRAAPPLVHGGPPQPHLRAASRRRSADAVRRLRTPRRRGRLRAAARRRPRDRRRCSSLTPSGSSRSQRAQLRESVVQAAPILANQRNLELAEWRAASDPLTGLPNRRAADETIRRMAAHAGPHAQSARGPADRPRPLQADQRPPRPRARRQGAGGGRQGAGQRPCAPRTSPRATAARSSSCCCPTPTAPARARWPRRSGAAIERGRDAADVGR